MKEEKHERFKRLAEYRTNEILKRLRILGNCSNKSQYQWNEKDIKRIFDAISKEIKTTKNLFLNIKKQFKF